MCTANMLHVFYQCVVASAVCLAAMCGSSSIRASDSNKKQKKLIKKAGSVLGTALETLELVVERRMLHKLLNIMDNTTHRLHQPQVRQSVFSQRLLQLHWNKNHDCKNIYKETRLLCWVATTDILNLTCTIKAMFLLISAKHYTLQLVLGFF